MTTSSPLATRCSTCGTAFRVVQDQLKVSEGWVRCGRCDTVFNALEQLFDLQHEPLPPNAAGGDARRTHASLPELPSDDAPRPPLADAFSALLRARAGSPGPTGGGRAAAASPSPLPGSAGAAAAFTAWPALPSSQPALADIEGNPGLHAEADGGQAQVDLLLDGPGDDSAERPPVAARDDAALGAADGGASIAAADGGASTAAANGGASAVAAEPGGATAAADGQAAAAAAATPDFVRAAERDARWRRPPVRRAVGAAIGVLLLALALQAVHQFRDGLAARWPSARPWLAGWCAQAGCSVGPLRRIGDVTVETTTLAPLGDTPGTFQLALTLRNRGRWALALPAVDLNLTDSNGQLVARRVLSPADFAPAAGLLGPDADTRLQTVLATETRVVGYTVELFYP